MKHLVDPELEGIPPKDRMAKRAEMTAKLYAAEDDEIKDAVRKELKEQVAKLEEGRTVLHKLVEGNPKPLDRDEIAK